MLIKLYIITLPVLLAIDLVWLRFVAKGFYQDKIGYLMKPEINLVPALIFYLLFALALVIFVISPALSEGVWTKALLLGLFLGFVSYAAYDLTNHATIRDWPLMMTVVDMLWGALLSGATSVIAYFIARKIGL